MSCEKKQRMCYKSIKELERCKLAVIELENKNKDYICKNKKIWNRKDR